MFTLVVILLLLYIFTRFTCGRTDSVVCLAGKTALVTGGNSGIGYQICLKLAARGCRLIIADKADQTATKRKIIDLTHNTNVVTKYIDLASFNSIRSFAKELIESEERLDILINNAGIGGAPKEITEDGNELTMQVNHYGPYLLTHLLIGLLKKSSPSRVIFTSSCLAYLSIPTLGLMKQSVYSNSIWRLLLYYSYSKLCVAICSDIIAKRLYGTGVTCNSCHPGIVRTPIFWESYKLDPSFLIPLSFLVTLMFGKTPEEGAQTAVHLATSNDLNNVTGEFFWDCKRFIKPPQMRNKKFCKKVWEITENIAGLKETEKL